MTEVMTKSVIVKEIQVLYFDDIFVFYDTIYFQKFILVYEELAVLLFGNFFY